MELKPSNDKIRIDQAEVLLELERFDEAGAALEKLSPRAQQDERAQRVRAQLDFMARGQALDAAELRRKVQDDPNDFAALLALADWHASRGEYEPALERLLQVVRQGRGFDDDAGRKKMLAIFDLLGNSGELVSRYRRQLAAALN